MRQTPHPAASLLDFTLSSQIENITNIYPIVFLREQRDAVPISLNK